MILKKTYFLRLIFFLILLILLSNQILSFDSWMQIDQYKYYRLYDWLNTSSKIRLWVHIPRFTLLYPCILINDFFGISVNFSYGIYVISILYLVGIIWQKIAQYSTSSNYWPFICSILPMCMSFIINGRFAFSMLGLSLIIFKAYSRKYEHQKNNSYITEFIGLYLSTVSSGSFFFGLCLFTTINFNRIIKSNLYNLSLLLKLKLSKKNTLKNIFENLFLSLMFLLFTMFTIKNFNYYGGFNLYGFNGILSHGFGVFFSPSRLLNKCTSSTSQLCEFFYILNSNISVLILTFITVSILIYLFFQLLKNNNLNYYCKLTIIFSMISGIFGITAFLSILLIIPQLRIRPFTTAKIKSF